jgi:hypothetical protein
LPFVFSFHVEFAMPDPMKRMKELLAELTEALAAGRIRWEQVAFKIDPVQFPIPEEVAKDVISYTGVGADWNIYVTSWDEGLHLTGKPSGERSYDGAGTKGMCVIHLSLPGMAKKVFEYAEKAMRD